MIGRMQVDPSIIQRTLAANAAMDTARHTAASRETLDQVREAMERSIDLAESTRLDAVRAQAFSKWISLASIAIAIASLAVAIIALSIGR